MATTQDLTPGSGRKPRPIIVKFISRFPRGEVLTKAKKLKDSPTNKRVFIAEDITSRKAKLLNVCKSNVNVNNAMVRKGTVHCSMNDNTKVVVENPDDLFKIVGVDDIDWRALGLEQYA